MRVRLLKPLASYASCDSSGTELQSLVSNSNYEKESVYKQFTVNASELRKLKQVISFRVPAEAYLKYKKLDDDRKQAIKQALIHLIMNSEKLQVIQQQNVTILNMPVNINLVKNENKPEIRQEVRMDPEITREYVAALREELRRAKEIIKRKNEEIKALRQKLQLLSKLARHGDVRSIRKILGV